LMVFAQRFVIPCLLFLAIARIDLGRVFDWRILASFYAGTVSCFILGILAARLFFKRTTPEAIAVGFSATFANTVLLGVPIVERAFGDSALEATFVIVAFHAPVCYTLGIAAMETVLNTGKTRLQNAGNIAHSVFSNPLMIGILAGAFVNLTGLPLPELIAEPMDILARCALGVAVFSLGGILTKYRLNDRILEIALVTGLRLIWHPLLAYFLAHHVFALPIEYVRGIVVTAAMAPGVNSYVYANIYDRGKGTAASSILVGTALSVLTVFAWLYILS